jgi:hypothetical protein
MIAPMVNYKNNRTIYKGGIFPPFTSSKEIVNRTIHVPSLNRL